MNEKASKCNPSHGTILWGKDNTLENPVECKGGVAVYYTENKGGPQRRYDERPEHTLMQELNMIQTKQSIGNVDLNTWSIYIRPGSPVGEIQNMLSQLSFNLKVELQNQEKE